MDHLCNSVWYYHFPLTLHITCIRLSVNVTCKLWFVALFCTRDIYCMSVHPGRGIPPLWLFLRFPPLFFLFCFFYPVKRVFFPLTCEVFPHSNRGSKYFCGLALTKWHHFRSTSILHLLKCAECVSFQFGFTCFLSFLSFSDKQWHSTKVC